MGTYEVAEVGERQGVVRLACTDLEDAHEILAEMGRLFPEWRVRPQKEYASDSGDETGWQIDVQTPHVQAVCTQTPRAGMHRNWLLTQHIDYTIQQFVMNRCQGTVALNGRSVPFQGYGYHEHNWGVQPRHSTAHWLHFWTPESAGVVLSCFYDSGVPHHYSFLWREKELKQPSAPASRATCSSGSKSWKPMKTADMPITLRCPQMPSSVFATR